MKILNFGSLNNDYVYKVPHFVQPGETLSVKSMQRFAGGKGLNQSIAVAKAGQNIFHAGFCGHGGEELMETLERENVNTSFMKKCDVFQGQALVQVDDAGQNCILVFGGSNTGLSAEYIDEVLGKFDKDTYVLLQNETNMVGYIIEKAAALDMQIVFNPAPFTRNLLEIDLAQVSWLIINEVEGFGITGENTTKGIIDKLAESIPETGIVYTCGSGGVVCSYKGQQFAHGIYNVPVADTTAAGDTFIGYFLAGLVEEKPFEEILRMASVASSICVSREGASPSIPTIQEVTESSLDPVRINERVHKL